MKKYILILVGILLPLATRALEVSFPEVQGVKVGESMGPAEWIKYIFLLAQAMVGLAIIYAFVRAGLLWMTGGDNPGNIKEAKDRMTSAIIGLVILLGSYLLLQTINPQLVNIKNPGVNFGTDAPSGMLDFWNKLFLKKHGPGETCGSSFDCQGLLECVKENPKQNSGVCTETTGESADRVTGKAVAGVSIGSCNNRGTLCSSEYRCLDNLSGSVHETNIGNISGTCTKKPAPGENCVVDSPTDSATSCFKGTCDPATTKCVFAN